MPTSDSANVGVGGVVARRRLARTSPSKRRPHLGAGHVEEHRRRGQREGAGQEPDRRGRDLEVRAQGARAHRPSAIAGPEPGQHARSPSAAERPGQRRQPARSRAAARSAPATASGHEQGPEARQHGSRWPAGRGPPRAGPAGRRSTAGTAGGAVRAAGAAAGRGRGTGVGDRAAAERSGSERRAGGAAGSRRAQVEVLRSAMTTVSPISASTFSCDLAQPHGVARPQRRAVSTLLPLT